jgi:integrase
VRQNVAAIDDKPKAPRREMRSLSADEIARLMDTAAGTDLAAPSAVALASGARRGELLGLKWEDVDFERGTLSIRRSLEQVRIVKGRAAEGKVIAVDVFVAEKTPKSGKSRLVSSCYRRALSSYCARCDVNARVARAAFQPATFSLIPTTAGRGHPIGSRTGSGSWSGKLASFRQGSGRRRALALKKQGAQKLPKEQRPPSITFHTLRHTCASILLGQGIHPKVVQEMLGHSSVSITMDLYSHVTPSLQTEAAQRLDAILRPSLAAVSGLGA